MSRAITLAIAIASSIFTFPTHPHCTPKPSPKKTLSPETSTPKKSVPEKITYPNASSFQEPSSRYRGWDFLANRLLQEGVSPDDVELIYTNPAFPKFSFVPFSPNPKEHASIYAGFLKPPSFVLGATFARQYEFELAKIERTLQVPREVVVAILVIESQLGKNTGDYQILYRLSRVASVGMPENVEHNLRRLKPSYPSLTREQLTKRADYLEQIFLPEIPALIEIGKRNKINPLNVRGSVAGAFGLPQFLPSAFLRFGVDGDKNGYVSLYSDVDALWSTANYLASYGYNDALPLAEKRAIIWKYNKSDAYIDAVLGVAAGIRRELQP